MGGNWGQRERAEKLKGPRRLTAPGSPEAGGRPEPEPDLNPAARVQFDRLLRQSGGHLKKADSANVNLAARMLAQEVQATACMEAIDAASDPANYLSARRCLTSLQVAISGQLAKLALAPKARSHSVELEPLPEAEETPKGGKAAGLPFINDAGITTKEARVLAGVVWDEHTLNEAEKQRIQNKAKLPSLKTLCMEQSKFTLMQRMLGRNWDGETVSMQTEEQADLIEFVANGGKEDE
jgi:hypothetical protein